MAIINIGTNADDGTGDTLRVAMQKINNTLAQVLAILTSPPIISYVYVLCPTPIDNSVAVDLYVAGSGFLAGPTMHVGVTDVSGMVTSVTDSLIVITLPPSTMTTGMYDMIYLGTDAQTVTLADAVYFA